jgi:acyl dehydratase
MDAMNGPLYFDELSTGDSWRSPGRTVTQTDIVNFACLTGDFNPLHVDHEFAKDTPFGRPVAHGLLGMSLVAGLGTHSPWASTTAFVGIRDWRFLKPIHEGDTLHVLTVVVEKTPKGRRNGTVVWRRQLVNQTGDVVQEGEFETLVSLAHTQTHDQYREQGAAVAGERSVSHNRIAAVTKSSKSRLTSESVAEDASVGESVLSGVALVEVNGQNSENGAPVSRGVLRRIAADVLELGNPSEPVTAACKAESKLP